MTSPDPFEFMRDFMGGFVTREAAPPEVDDGPPCEAAEPTSETPCCEPLVIRVQETVTIDLCPAAKPCRAHPEPAKMIGAL